jgi:hypothetical protein
MKFFRITNKGIEILDEINKLTSKIA